MRYYLFSLISLLLLAGGCKKTPQEPDLPPATQTGAYTFGCKINGKVWVPKGGLLHPVFDGGYYQNNLYLIAQRLGDDHSSITMNFLDSVKAPGKYIIKEGADGRQTGRHFDGTRSYLADTAGSGVLTLTKLDTVNLIVSGTFYFTATNDSGDIVHITDGRFDIKY